MFTTSTLILASTAVACGTAVLAHQPAVRERLWLLLGKRPLIAVKQPWPLVFRVSAHTVSRAQLETRYQDLQRRIRKTSHFQLADRQQLNHYYAEALRDLEAREAVLHARDSRHEQTEPEEAKPAAARHSLMMVEGQRWRHMLEVDSREKDPVAVKRAYRRKALEAHPDRGGSHEAMARVNAAYAAAKRELEL